MRMCVLLVISISVVLLSFFRLAHINDIIINNNNNYNNADVDRGGGYKVHGRRSRWSQGLRGWRLQRQHCGRSAIRSWRLVGALLSPLPRPQREWHEEWQSSLDSTSATSITSSIGGVVTLFQPARDV